MMDNTMHREMLMERCVDGELDRDQQLELVRLLDAANVATGWRLLAIRFMEQQVLCSFFQEVSSREAQQQLQSLSHQRFNEDSSNHSLSQSDIPHTRVLTLAEKTISPVHRKDSSNFLLTVAFGLALGLGLNLLIQRQSALDSMSLATDELQETATSEHQFSSNALNLGKIPNGDKANSTPESGVTENIRVMNPPSLSSYPSSTGYPIDLTELSEKEMFHHQLILPDELRQQLESLGYEIECHSRCFRLPLENGREVVIPSDTLRVRYASH